MSDLAYPWPWAVECLQGFFTLRIPWLEEFLAAIRARHPTCLLLPEACGPLSDWSLWVGEYLWQEARTDVEQLPPGEDSRAILDHFQLDEPRDCDPGTAPWRATLLKQYANRVGYVEPRLVVVVTEQQGGRTSWEEWVGTQQQLNIPMICPIMLARDVPSSNLWHSIRFGAVQILGNVHVLDVSPQQDPARWTRLLKALTALWECSSIPAMADELWSEFNLELDLLDSPGFDARLRRVLAEFSANSVVGTAVLSGLSQVQAWVRPRPDHGLGLQPDEEPLWHAGVLAWDSLRFDLTSVAARVLTKHLTKEDEVELVRRRRIYNHALGRWLAGWATAVESGLRLAAIRVGQPALRRFLEQRRPFRAGTASRWTELHERDDEVDAKSPADIAEFVDLAEFIGRQPESLLQRGDLHKCRLARNAVVHERDVEAGVLVTLTRVLDWLRSQGLV